MSRVVPYIVDPAGALIHDLTGFKGTPGGQVSRLTNPPKPRPQPTPEAQPAPAPKPSIIGPRVSGGGAAPVATQDPQRKVGEGASNADQTRGLIKPGASRSLLTR